jgi:hypothetical protein
MNRISSLKTFEILELSVKYGGKRRSKDRVKTGLLHR